LDILDEKWDVELGYSLLFNLQSAVRAGKAMATAGWETDTVDRGTHFLVRVCITFVFFILLFVAESNPSELPQLPRVLPLRRHAGRKDQRRGSKLWRATKLAQDIAQIQELSTRDVPRASRRDGVIKIGCPRNVSTVRDESWMGGPRIQVASTFRK